MRGVDEFLGPAFFAGCGGTTLTDGVKLATWTGGGIRASEVPTPLSTLELTKEQLDGLTSIDVEPLTGRAMRYAFRMGRYTRSVMILLALEDIARLHFLGHAHPLISLYQDQGPALQLDQRPPRLWVTDFVNRGDALPKEPWGLPQCEKRIFPARALRAHLEGSSERACGLPHHEKHVLPAGVPGPNLFVLLRGVNVSWGVGGYKCRGGGGSGGTAWRYEERRGYVLGAQ